MPSSCHRFPGLLLAALLAGGSPPAMAEDPEPSRASGQVMFFIGTQLMLPYLHAIAARLVENAGLAPPLLENQSTLEGIKHFCQGVGLDTPDVVAVSRRLRGAELEDCRAHGVEEVVEVLIGYDATVVVSRSDDLDYPMTRQAFYRAVAAELPQDREFFPNAYTHWRQVDPNLPDTEIRVILPAPTLGGRAFLDNHLLQGACRDIPEIRSIFSADERVEQCITLRQDNRIFELDAPDDFEIRMVQALEASPPGTLAVVPLRFAFNQASALKIQSLEGVMPTRESVSNHYYSLIRPLYLFVKKAHIKNYLGVGPVHGLREFITEATRETTLGPDGYLADLGLIAMPDLRRSEARAASLTLTPTTR